MESVPCFSPPILLWFIDCQQSSEIQQGSTHSLLGHPIFCCPDLCWQSHMNYVMLLSAFFFFFLIRWISKIVAVQKLVVFFKKKTNSFSNILWNRFIPLFLSQTSAEYCCFYLVLLICKYCILKRCLRWKLFFPVSSLLCFCSYFLLETSLCTGGVYRVHVSFRQLCIVDQMWL